MMKDTWICLQLFGSFTATKNDQAIRFRSNKARLLLAYLVVEAGAYAVSREHLLDLFWPGYARQSARASLRTTLSDLRRALSPLSLIQSDRTSVQFDIAHPNFSCDFQDCKRILAKIEDQSLPIMDRQHQLGRLSVLSQNDLLSGFDIEDCPALDEWLQKQRESMRQHIRQELTQRPKTRRRPETDRLPVPPHPFVDRESELNLLVHWLRHYECRAIGIFGMGGQGKTALAIHAVNEVIDDDRFEFIHWQSLLNAPPFQFVVAEWLNAFSESEKASIPEHLEGQLALLFRILRQRRCLLILDNLESVLTSDHRSGHFRSTHDAYKQLIERMVLTEHKSMLLLTSREQPNIFVTLMQNSYPLRALALQGISKRGGVDLAISHKLKCEPETLADIVRRYSGNPLAILLVLRTVQHLYAGDFSAFLSEDTVIFDDIRDVLDAQMARLPSLERDLLLWLAVVRTPVSPSELGAQLIHRPSESDVIEALRSLRRRFLIQQEGSRLSLQNVVMEYLTDYLVEAVVHELATGEFERMHSHALLQANAVQFVRESQARLLLQRVVAKLIELWGQNSLLPNLQGCTEFARRTPAGSEGYLAANLLHICLDLHEEFIPDDVHLDFSSMTVREPLLSSRNLPNLNFANSELVAPNILEPFGWVRRIAYSADGTLLAAATNNGELRVWRIADFHLLWVTKAHNGTVGDIAFSPNGSLLATIGHDRALQLWNGHNGDLLGRTSIVFGGNALEFHPNCEILAGGDRDYLYVWHVPNIDTNAMRIDGFNVIRSLAFSPDGEELAISDLRDGGAITLWRLNDSVTSSDFKLQLGTVDSVAYSPNGRWLAMGTNDHRVAVWDRQTGHRILYADKESGGGHTVTFSPDSQTLAVTGLNRTIRLWDMRSATLRRVLDGHTFEVLSLDFSPDGIFLCSGGADHTIRVWNIQSGQPQLTLSGYENPLNSIDVSSNGNLLVAAGSNQVVYLWHLPSGTLTKQLRGHAGAVMATAFDPYSRIVATASYDHTVRLWDVNRDHSRACLIDHTDIVHALAFHPRESILASGGYDETIRLWTLPGGKRVNVIQAQGLKVRQMVFDPTGKYLFAVGNSRTLCRWHMGKCMHDWAALPNVDVPESRPGVALSLAMHPSGDYLACGAYGAIHILDTKQATIQHTLRHDMGWVSSISFSPDGRFLASRSGRPCLVIWDIRTGERYQFMDGHTGVVTALVFGADSRRLYSVSVDGTVKIWDITEGDCICTLRIPGPYAGINITNVTGLSAIQRSSMTALGATEDNPEPQIHKWRSLTVADRVSHRPGRTSLPTITRSTN